MTIPEHIYLPIAVVVSIIAALAFWWWWPRWQVNRLAPDIKDPKARADIEDKFRKTVGQLLGGAAVLFGAWVAFLQVSQQPAAQSQIAQQQPAAEQQQQQADAGLDEGPAQTPSLTTPASPGMNAAPYPQAGLPC